MNQLQSFYPAQLKKKKEKKKMIKRSRLDQFPGRGHHWAVSFAASAHAQECNLPASGRVSKEGVCVGVCSVTARIWIELLITNRLMEQMH